jgi:hypothetical protein
VSVGGRRGTRGGVRLVWRLAGREIEDAQSTKGGGASIPSGSGRQPRGGLRHEGTDAVARCSRRELSLVRVLRVEGWRWCGRGGCGGVCWARGDGGERGEMMTSSHLVYSQSSLTSLSSLPACHVVAPSIAVIEDRRVRTRSRRAWRAHPLVSGLLGWR